MLKALDLFCGAGGASMGLHRAGFEVTGVDIAPQPHYPFEFVQADALEYPLEGYDFVWASPPCQDYSRCKFLPGRGKEYPRLIEPTRSRLLAWGGRWVIENVPAAPLRYSVTLCGLMFGLRVFRHRCFETSSLILGPPHLRHRETIATRKAAHYTRDVGGMVTVAGHLFSLAAGSSAMGIDWMTRDELAEAIPPAYAQYIAQWAVLP